MYVWGGQLFFLVGLAAVARGCLGADLFSRGACSPESGSEAWALKYFEVVWVGVGEELMVLLPGSALASNFRVHSDRGCADVQAPLFRPPCGTWAGQRLSRPWVGPTQLRLVLLCVPFFPLVNLG